MQGYHHILLATDFSEHSNRVAQRALDLAGKFQADISLLHVVENLPVADTAYGPVIPFEINLTDQLIEAANKRLDELAEALAVPEDRRWVEIGSAKNEIVRIADEKKADLIVVGSHGRHGLALLLGSTAASVMHHAKCDVLAVRIQE
jgi:universal stress protein A